MQTIPANGPHLRNLREIAGLTQQQLADKSGVSKRTIQKLEAGEAALPTATFQPLAEVLGVERREIMLYPEMPIPGMTEGASSLLFLGIQVQGDIQDLDHTSQLPILGQKVLQLFPGAQAYIVIYPPKPGGSIYIPIMMTDLLVDHVIRAFAYNPKHFEPFEILSISPNAHTTTFAFFGELFLGSSATEPPLALINVATSPDSFDYRIVRNPSKILAPA